MAAGVSISELAMYCGCSDETIEALETDRAEGFFMELPATNRERYGFALGACQTWLAENKPDTAGDIHQQWLGVLEQTRERV
jgi:hypothetical protein